MRIGLVTGEYPPMQGGIAAHCRVLAQTLIAQGHSVAVFSDERADEPDARIRLTRKPGRWRGRTLRALNAWAIREELDVVNLHYQTAAYQMSPWVHFIDRYQTAAPLVTTFHDLRYPYLFPKAGRLRDWVVRRLARVSAGVIATNHEDASQLAAHPCHALIPIGSSVHTALPPGYDRDEWRSQAGADPETFLVGHFGFVNHSKGVDTLIESVARLRQSGMVIRLLMIGGRTGSSDPTNAATVAQIDAQIAVLGLADAVRWTGFVDDASASAYFDACDVIALPFRDGASYRRSSLMAAIAHTCPIITTKPAVPIPTFINGQNLLLIAPENVPALSAALQVVARSPEQRDALRAGVRQLQKVFDWDAIARDNIAFFEQVIAGAVAGRKAAQ